MQTRTDVKKKTINLMDDLDAPKKIENIWSKLMRARVLLQSRPLKKSGHNKYAGFKYFELGDFLPEIQRIFADIGLCGHINFGSNFAELKILNSECPDEIVVFTCPNGSVSFKKESDPNDIQNIGAIQTYQRRYLWMVALEIAEHDAIDASPPMEASEIHVVEAQQKTLSQSQVDNILELCVESEMNPDKICDGFGVDRLEEIKQKNYSKILSRLEELCANKILVD